ncbi:ras guanyl-releasing protein 3-like isoform X3 [Anneissia japonica]|nr:ras guanyl-releasing protein 3-like isoform X3 [Anneissia japonica]XP_033115854.1 ras guanyl-releasing protein 3-like isoform X3 [Anneissia japonica]XP_033115855.1 ras guanyl-releasing protein 3-like isoform X3 [Anneissia japonica]
MTLDSMITRRKKLSTSSTYSESMEEDKVLFPGLSVKVAAIDKLAELCVECFDDAGKVIDDSSFPRVLFLMHEWFMLSEELATQFLQLYQSSNKSHCSKASCLHNAAAEDCHAFSYRRRICHAIRYWILNWPVHFDLDKKLYNVLQQFQTLLQADGNSQLITIIDVSNIPSYDWMRVVSVRNPVRGRNRKVSLVFNHLEPTELADHLTFLEYKVFRRLNFSDFKSYALSGQLKDNVKLERSIGLFNGLSMWIQCMVLSRHTPKQRAEVMEKFVNVAIRLQELNNFNTLMAVVGGLSHSSLARLRQTNSHISPEKQKIITEMTEMLSSASNFSNYRKYLNEAKGFKIPILGVHLKDLVLLHTALPDKTEKSHINFRKMAQLMVTFEELMRLTHMKPPVEPNMDLVNMLKVSLDLKYTEDEIYELSLAREPRNSANSAPPTPTKPHVFAAWASGVSSPSDNETIGKHVSAMVEAVFKNYDNDKDGYISYAEFQAISSNFPFMESFCVLDADQDGLISKIEMKNYFVKANSLALRNSFKHDFHVHTYFSPTFCSHCTGLLWGIIKQGVKCRICGINSHKHCKNRIVMECRAKKSTGLNNGSSSPNGMRRRHTMDCSKMNGVHIKYEPTSPDSSPGDTCPIDTCPIDSCPIDTSPIDTCSLETCPEITLAQKRKMSMRQKARLVQQSTQTEEYESDKDSDRCSVTSSNYPSICTVSEDERYSSMGSRYSGSVGSLNKRDEVEELRERLMTLDQEKAYLASENEKLRLENQNYKERNRQLQSNIDSIKRHTLSFIFDQMDTLHKQEDSKV